MLHTGKKESKKEKLKKTKKTNEVKKNLIQGDSSADPLNQLKLKVIASIDWTISVSNNNSSLQENIYSFSMVIDSFQG